MDPQRAKTAGPTGDRLRRVDQQAEQFVQPPERPLSSLIVMGASAGGYHAIQEAIKELTPDLPAAVIILLHSGRDTVSAYPLEHFLSQYTEVPIQAVQRGGGPVAAGTDLCDASWTRRLPSRTNVTARAADARPSGDHNQSVI
ncbi:MAG TPA: chemotaxis protein CheB [Nitrospira sp.]|nr:chemotaxis protein CheB [Nitrospira sp.]